MRCEKSLSADDVREILRQHFRLKEAPILYFEGGFLKPPVIKMVFFEELK